MLLKSILQGFGALLRGIQLCTQKKYLALTAIPLTLNSLGFLTAIYLAYQQTLIAVDTLGAWLPDAIGWFKWLMVPVVIISTYLVMQFCFLFSLNLISAPFHSVLAERVFQDLKQDSSQEVLPDIKWLQVFQDAFARQWQKLKYSLPKLLICFLIGLVPVLGQLLAPVLTCIVGGWLLAIEYLDFHMEHQEKPFIETLKYAKNTKVRTLSYGIALLACALIHLINFILMPAAVCGAAYLIHNHPKTNLT